MDPSPAEYIVGFGIVIAWLGAIVLLGRAAAPWHGWRLVVGIIISWFMGAIIGLLIFTVSRSITIKRRRKAGTMPPAPQPSPVTWSAPPE